MAEARAEARDKGKTTKAKAGRPRPRPRAEARGQAWGLRSAAGLSISPVLLMRIIAQPSYELLIDWLQGVPQPISQALQGPETRGRRASGHTHTHAHTRTHTVASGRDTRAPPVAPPPPGRRRARRLRVRLRHLVSRVSISFFVGQVSSPAPPASRPCVMTAAPPGGRIIHALAV